MFLIVRGYLGLVGCNFFLTGKILIDNENYYQLGGIMFYDGVIGKKQQQTKGWVDKVVWQDIRALPQDRWESLWIEGDNVYIGSCHRVVRLARADFVSLLQQIGCHLEPSLPWQEPGCWHELGG